MKQKIYYKHTDCGGIVYHSNFIDFCEMARSDLFFSKGLSPIIDGCHFALKNINAQFINPAYLGDELEVKTRVKNLKRASVEIYHEIFVKEQMVFNMEALLVFLSKDMKITRIPDDTIEFFKKL
jgi:acyl-CoA thioester hydrolase